MFGKNSKQGKTRANGHSNPNPNALITLREVVKTFHTAAGPFTALKGVDIDIEPGQFVAVVGKSGCGKSTLVNMITGIDRPTTGEVWVGQTPVHTLTEGQMARWRGRNLGVIFQFFQLLPTLTVLVVLSIAVGVFAVGTVAHMQVIVSDDLDASYAAISPANITLQTAETFDDDLLETIRRMPEVAEAEGRYRMIIRFKTGPDESWHPLLLYALADYENIRINKVRQEIVFEPDPAHWPTGAWPPPNRELALERTSLLMAPLGLTRSALGDTLIIKTPAGKERAMPVSGLAYDFGHLPATFSGLAIGIEQF